MDPEGRFAVSLLSGHEGGANRLAREVAAITGGEAVITTATDNHHIPALDVLAREHGWKMDKHSRLAGVAAAMVNGDPVNLICPPKSPCQMSLQNSHGRTTTVASMEIWQAKISLTLSLHIRQFQIRFGIPLRIVWSYTRRF